MVNMNKNVFYLKRNKYVDDTLTSTKASIDFLLEKRFIHSKNAHIYQQMLEWLKENHPEYLI
jgi:hypothetical protein